MSASLLMPHSLTISFDPEKIPTPPRDNLALSCSNNPSFVVVVVEAHLIKRLIFPLAILCVLGSFVPSIVAQTPQKPDRQVAITIDDLPAGMADRLPAADISAMTAKLLGTLRDQKIPVVGFVNEKKLYKPGEVDERIKALQMWLDYGFELGNHTFSHASLNQVGLKAWEEEVIRGESVTSMLLAPRKMKLRYFRHPYLDTGRDLQTRRQAEAFLVERGYRIAPVTLDGWDWMFAGLYEDAKKRSDTVLQQQIVKEYLAYHDASFAYAEQLSVKVVGYEPKQVLLLHASNLEADHIGELMDVLRKRGYRFITLEDALGDQAYSLPDTYVGEEGTGWIDHWAITQGKIPQGAPAFPQWVMDRTKSLHLSTGTVPAEPQ
jgi:peptidoglycan/xylan/chitin deacetylase (PgdA/CDA1 family)